jgi:FkbM family methyltransferase
MITALARFAKDSYCVLRAPYATWKKVELWSHLLYPSNKILGFKVSCFDRSTLIFLYREIFARQHYFFAAATENPTILDCGANIGMATLYFKWLYPGADIKAFEPEPSTFRLLETNVRQNRLTGTDIHNCALWDQNGTVDFFIDPGTAGSPLMSTDKFRLNGEAIQVAARKLSDFIEGTVDLLKIDVEGAEHRILCDLVTSRKIEFVKELIVEYHHRIGNQHSCLAAFLKLLEDSGFEYQIDASLFGLPSQHAFQDILIRAHR